LYIIAFTKNVFMCSLHHCLSRCFIFFILKYNKQFMYHYQRLDKKNDHCLLLPLKPVMNILFCICTRSCVYVRFCHCFLFILIYICPLKWNDRRSFIQIGFESCCVLFIKVYTCIPIYDDVNETHYKSSAFLTGSNVTSTNLQMLSVSVQIS
jgi:hypothetical protein